MNDNKLKAQGFVRAPQYRDGCRHYVNEETLEVISFNLFRGGKTVSSFEDRIISDHFASQNLLKKPRFRHAFVNSFPNVENVENVEKCRRQNDYFSPSYKKFCYVDNVTQDVYQVTKISPVRWEKLEDPEKINYILLEHFEPEDVRKERLEREAKERKDAYERRREPFLRHMREEYGYDGERIRCPRRIINDPVIFNYFHPTEDDRKKEHDSEKVYQKFGQTECDAKPKHTEEGLVSYIIPRMGDFIVGLDVPPGVIPRKLVVTGDSRDILPTTDLSKLFLPHRAYPYSHVVLLCDLRDPENAPPIRVRTKMCYYWGLNDSEKDLWAFLKDLELYTPFQDEYVGVTSGIAYFTKDTP